MKYARIIGTIVHEIFIPPEGYNIIDCFVPEVVDMFEIVPDNVEVGWIQIDNN